MGPWLYVVLLGACIMLYARLKPGGETARTAGIGEIEQTLEQFALELEEDNRQIMEAATGMRSKLEAEIMKLAGRLDALEKQMHVYAQALSAMQSARQGKAAAHVDGERTELQPEPADMKSRYPEIFQYYEQGKSIEYIAKKTGMNKGEVELIIHLSKQEEQFRAQR